MPRSMWVSRAEKARNPLTAKDYIRSSLRDVRVGLRRFIDRVLPAEPFGPFEYAATFKASQRIEGDYLEFGVYTGRSFVTAYHLIKRAERLQGLALKTRFFSFDSFGAPEGAVEWKLCTEDEFLGNLKRNRVNLGDVVIVKGFYEDILKSSLAEEIGLEQAAIVFLDCTARGTAAALEWVTDYLVDGAIIIFDQWFILRANPIRGQQGAFYGWAARHPELKFSDFVGVESGATFHGLLKSVVVHR